MPAFIKRAQMDPRMEYAQRMTRRQLLGNSARPLGAAALASLMGTGLSRTTVAAANEEASEQRGLPGLPHFAPKAKRVIYLFMCGGPSHIDLFDYHPEMRELHGQELPESVRQGQRLTGMTSGQSTFPCVAPMFEFQRYGQHGTWVSELLPNVATMVDDISIVKSIYTEAINHDPAITFINTASDDLNADWCGPGSTWIGGVSFSDRQYRLVMW